MKEAPLRVNPEQSLVFMTAEAEGLTKNHGRPHNLLTAVLSLQEKLIRWIELRYTLDP